MQHRIQIVHYGQIYGIGWIASVLECLPVQKGLFIKGITIQLHSVIQALSPVSIHYRDQIEVHLSCQDNT